MSIEQGLIERARLGGDTRAFSRLVQLHQGNLRSFLLRLCHRHDLSDDLAQETFLLAHRKLASYSGKGSFAAWLFQIAYRCFLEDRRREARRNEINRQYGQQFEVLHTAYEEINLQQIDLEQALAQLDIPERAAISLCHSYGLSHSQAAQVLAIPLGTVKTHIQQGKVKLRLLLNNDRSQAESR